MTFSEQIVNAMVKPASYKELVQLKKGRFKLFVVVICLVLGIVTFAVPTGALIASFGGFEKLFSRQLSTLEFRDGELSLANRFTMKIDDVTILIDTKGASVGGEELKRDGIYLAVGSQTAQLVYTLAGESFQYQVIHLPDLLGEGFSCNTLLRLIPFIYGYLVMVFLFTCLGFFLKYGLFSLVMGLYINKINKEKKLGLSFGQVFMICFYGQTLGMLISNFNAALGLIPQIFVSTICIFISIRMITASVVCMLKDAE